MSEQKGALNDVGTLRGLKVGICVSGGLDSKTVAKRLKDEGCDVTCFCADLAQPDETDVQDIRKKMAPCGVETIIVDLKNEMAEAAFDVIMAQAKYDGGYWQSTGIGRHVTSRGLITKMKEMGIQVLAHGATGRGNDQVRFERYTNVLAPNMKVYAPWRDPKLLSQFPGRTQMLQFLNAHGIQHELQTTKKKYSTDANVAGLSHEAEDLEEITTPMTIVIPILGKWPQDCGDKEDVKVRFEKGRCVEINGQKVTPLQALQLANTIGGRNGVGLSHALENRIIGTKSRGVYEAPGMTLLGRALEYLYQAALDRRSNDVFKFLSQHVADQLYQGRYFDPSTQASLTAIRELASRASGLVEVQLYRGNIYFSSMTELAYSMYNAADASMEASDGLNPVSSQGFVEVQSVEAKVMALRGYVH
jgi:argininosuccinate synthase